MCARQPHRQQLLASAWLPSFGTELWEFYPGAMTQSVGDGCRGNGTPPTLTVSDPVLGATASIAGRGAPAPSIAAIFPRTPLLLLSTCRSYVAPLGAVLLGRVDDGELARSATGPERQPTVRRGAGIRDPAPARRRELSGRRRSIERGIRDDRTLTGNSRRR